MKLRDAAVVFLLAGCSAAPLEPRSFDLGLEAPGVRLPAVRVGTVKAVVPFETVDMQYRLAYRNAAEISAFATSRWATTPADMFRKQLLRATGEGPAKCSVDIEIQEFSQVFSAKDASDARIELRAWVRAGTGRSFSVVEANAGPDAASGAAAFARAANRAVGEIGSWIAAQPGCS